MNSAQDDKPMKLNTVTKLKLISLFTGMMFWYGIEQLFMDNVLRDPSARAWTTAVFVVTWLIFDIPGGVLADKFGRRRILIASFVLQTIGVAMFIASQSLPVFLIGAFFYGLHWSTFAGTIQALMYDHLLDDERTHEYPKHQGSVTAYGYIGAGIANVFSGIIASHSTLRVPYVVSLIPLFLGLIIAISLTEAKRTKSDLPAEKRDIRSYITEFKRTVKRQPIVAVYSAQIMIGLIIFMTICEFGQILLVTYNDSPTILGLLWAIDAAVVAIGLRYAHHVQRWPWQTIGLYGIVLVLFSLIRNPFAIVLFMLVYVGAEIMHNISETELQHATPSHSRATVLSSVTFMGNVIALPLIWLFNSVVQSQSIHAANHFMAIGAALCLFVTTVIVARHVTEKRARS